MKKQRKRKRKKGKVKRVTRAITAAALNLLKDPAFLHHVCNKIGELGVVGEERNRLIVFLAALTAILLEPVSILYKGLSASGKSKLLRTVIQILPPECVRVLSSLSKKAQVLWPTVADWHGAVVGWSITAGKTRSTGLGCFNCEIISLVPFFLVG